MNKQWITCWSKAQRGMGLTQHLFHPHQCVKLKLPKATSFTFRFATFYDEQEIEITNVFCESAQGKQAVLFEGTTSYTLLAQHAVTTDPIHFNEEVEELVLTYDINCASPMNSGVQLHFYDAVEAQHDVLYGLCGVDADTTEVKGCISVFGDSITEQGNWTSVLATWCKEQGYLLLNHGISGNRLLRKIEEVSIDPAHAYMFEGTDLDQTSAILGIHHGIALSKQCFGISGVARFQRDILDACSGLQGVIFALGVNDLYQPGTFCASIAEIPSLSEYMEGYEKIQALTNKQGIALYNLALTPFGGSDSHSSAKEALRLSINEFLAQTQSNGFIPLDDVLCVHPAMMKDDYHGGDHLHPNQAGGKQIALRIQQELSTLWENGSC